MTIRSVLLAATALCALAPFPALAHDRDSRAADIGARLADPGTQMAVTTMLAALGEAVLDIRVAPFVTAMRSVDPDGAGDLPPDARLRDLAGPSAARLPGTIGREVPRAMSAAAGMAQALEDMTPQLRALGDRVRQAMPPD